MKSKNNKLFLLVLVVTVFSVANLYFSGMSKEKASTYTYSDFLSHVGNGQVQEVQFYKDKVIAKDINGSVYETVVVKDAELVSLLKEKDVQISARSSAEDSGSFGNMLIGWLPFLLFIGVIFFFMRRSQGGKGPNSGPGAGPFSFGKSRAKTISNKENKVRLKDVAGVEEAKEEVAEIVDFLKNPMRYRKIGAKIPKGCLLVGPPGTGKTLLAKAVAGEANVPFFTISGSDFVEMFVGVGASRVRDMFEQARKKSPCIVFIDEIDAVGRHRGAGVGGGNDEREQTLNQLLVEMDGFSESEGIIIMAATNRPDVLDPALLRPGRFDRQITVTLPDVEGRAKILDVHMARALIANDVDSKTIARSTPGFSGADLANLVNEAALHAARTNKTKVSMEDFENAKDKIFMGPERRSMVMSDEDKKLTAYHEAGHALVGLHVPSYDPLHKVTIIPRGRALGVTMSLPEKDKLNYSEEGLKSQLAVLFGGRMAEELIFGKEQVTTGASSDIQKATEISRRMVTEFGFSDKLGRIRYNQNQDEVFLGYSVGQQKNISEATSSLIDEEVRRLINEAEEKAREILTKFSKQLEDITQGLLEFETLSGEEVIALTKGVAVKETRAKNKEFFENKEKQELEEKAKLALDDSKKSQDDKALKEVSENTNNEGSNTSDSVSKESESDGESKTQAKAETESESRPSKPPRKRKTILPSDDA